MRNKPETAQVGAISKAQKQQKDSKVSSILFYIIRMRKFFLKSPVSRIVPKNVNGGPFGVFEHPFCCKIGKK